MLERDYGTSAEIVLKLMTGAFPGIPDFDFPIVDVRDVADLHVAALRAPDAAGERFLCVGGNMTMHEMASVLRAHMPERANKLPRRSLPHWMVRAASLFDPVTRAVIFDLGIRRACDTSKPAASMRSTRWSRTASAVCITLVAMRPANSSW